MRTDELIQILSTNLKPIERGHLTRSIALAVAAGALAALALALLALGMRPDLHSARAVGYLLLKLAFTLGIAVTSALLLARLVRPGGEEMTPMTVAAIPFGAIVLLAILSIAADPKPHGEAILTGEMWLECLVSIPIIAIVPFALIVWVVRRVAAPTDLPGTGAAAGLVGGGVSAMGYAFHCSEDSVPFVALWYGGTIALCSLAGAMLGRRLLRW